LHLVKDGTFDDTAPKFTLFSVSGLKDENLTKKQTYIKTETCKLYSEFLKIILPNVIKTDRDSFEQYSFKLVYF